MSTKEDSPYTKPWGEIIQIYLPVDVFVWIFSILCLIVTVPLCLAGAIMFGYWERGSQISTVGIALFLIGIVLGAIVIFSGILFAIYIYFKRKVKN